MKFQFLSQATFFINAINLDPSHAGRAQADTNRKTLYNVAVGGHDIGDHSYNHMKHNSKVISSRSCKTLQSLNTIAV